MPTFLNQEEHEKSHKKAEKQAIKDAAKFSNFCQKLKMELWEEGFTGEAPMDRVALKMWDWMKNKSKT